MIVNSLKNNFKYFKVFYPKFTNVWSTTRHTFDHTNQVELFLLSQSNFTISQCLIWSKKKKEALGA